MNGGGGWGVRWRLSSWVELVEEGDAVRVDGYVVDIGKGSGRIMERGDLGWWAGVNLTERGCGFPSFWVCGLPCVGLRV